MGYRETWLYLLYEVGSMKDFIEFIVKHMVNHPEDVQVGEVEGEHFVVYELRVAKKDMGIVIGRRGQNAKAIRHLLNAAAAARTRKRVTLEILE
jgi:predicted RNA-binding protein YlqC (UPF0109 family)